jgi:rare lipoprotein A (peptidoglycan hydrolase)
MRRAVIAALAVVALAAPAEARNNVCIAAGLKGIPLLNCELRTYVHRIAGCARQALATSYGNGDGYLHKPVSAGGVLDAKTPTVAHKTLRLGSYVELSRGGRSVKARVTDRGPYTIAEFDLSPATGRALGIEGESGYVCVQ